ncbi:MAG: tetratricopeptide repeat protein [Sulfuricella sp.]|nr:tetratricopeptide repeat protein [Sulfuricella sp.]
MATYDLEEQEQIDALKTWWKQNGTMVILAATVFFATVVGVQGWRYYQNTQSAKASLSYGILQSVARGGDIKRVRDAAGQVMEQYPSTAYATRAALIVAGVNYDSGDVQSAKAQLQWAIDHTKESEVRDIARLRLAGVLLDEKKYPEAQKLMDEQSGPSFTGLFADLKGDILAAQGKATEARAAYQTAFDKSGEKSQYRQIIQMKLDSLGGK